VPGCTDGYELAVRAVLGQQISVAAARTFAARIVRRWGEEVETDEPALTHLFPSPDVLADADLESVGLTGRRAATLRALSKAVSDGELLLDRETEREETLARLMALPGIGPWTAGYVAMRALGDPDAFPTTDLGLRAAARRLGEPGDAGALTARSERWRPWRSYAAMHLWASLT
jgi:AraC family transcriptional regulator of adaptative response / DNA-3-methyladenine glycosylase II